MAVLRTMLSVVVALALVVVPTVAQSTGVVAPGQAKPVASASDVSGQPGAAMAPMKDCAKMTGAVADADGSCCGSDSSCPRDICVLKCFQLLGIAPVTSLQRPPARQAQRAAEPVRPPDWSWRPQPPPPRT